MNLNDKIIKFYYESSSRFDDEQLKFFMLWNSFLLLCEKERLESDGVRQGMRRFIETHYDDMDKDIDYEDSRLDVYYERPVFEDGKVEEDRDLYYYQDFNTNRQYRSNDDYILSIKNFQKILEESDLISIYMSIFKLFNYCSKKDYEETERDNRLIIGANYLLESALNNLLN